MDNTVGDKIWKFIEKNKYYIFMIAITILSILVRKSLIYFESDDLKTFVLPWIESFKEHGGLAGLGLEIGNYNFPYRTILAIISYIEINPIILVKSFSIIFDYISAFTAMEIVTLVLKDNKHKKIISFITYAIILFLPTVIANSACWGQADSIYAAFILLAIKYAIKNKYVITFIFLGLSFAFKLQFIFILPLFIFMFISERKFKWYYFLIIPLVNFILCLPAIIAGQPLTNIFTVYMNQTETISNEISRDFPGIWNLLLPVQDTNSVILPHPNMNSVGIYVTLFVFAVMAFLVFDKKIKFNGKNIVEFGLWSIMISTFLLPNMHDRYLYVGDILSVLYFIFNKDKIYVPIIINAVSTYTYSSYLFQARNIPIQYIAIAYFIVIILVTKDLYKKYLCFKKIKEAN